MHYLFQQFIPYPIALALKEAGFDEPCFATNDMGAIVGIFDPEQFRVTGFQTVKNSELHDGSVAAPLYQQVFDWLELNNLRIVDYWIYSAKKWHIGIFDAIMGMQMWPENFLAEIEPENYLYEYKLDAWNEAITAAIKILKNGQ